MHSLKIKKLKMLELQITQTRHNLSIFGRKNVSVRVYAVIISKYATKIVGTQKRQVACVRGTQDQKQSTFNTFKPAQ